MANILAIAGPDSRFRQPGARPAGFLAGLWHGLISPFCFLVSLFHPGVRIYEVQNRGVAYDYGFMIGISAIFVVRDLRRHWHG